MAGFIVAPYAPPFNAFYGVNSQFLSFDFWREKTKVNPELFFNEYAGRVWNGMQVPAAVFQWCDNSASVEMKLNVSRTNTQTVKAIANFFAAYLERGKEQAKADAYLQNFQKVDLTFQFEKTLTFTSIQRGNSKSRSSSTTSKISVNVAPAIYDHLAAFVKVNGRLPNKIFADDDNSHYQLDVLSFQQTANGYVCPNWALFSVIASNQSHAVKATDDGFCFVNNDFVSGFFHSYWWNVAPKTGWMIMDREAFSFTTKLLAGKSLIPGASLTAVKIDPYRSGPNLGEIRFYLLSGVLNSVSAAYKSKLDEIEAESIAAWNAQSSWVSFRDSFIGAIFHAVGFFSQVMALSALPSLGSNFLALLNGSFTYSNIISSVQFLDTLKIIDADRVLALNKLLTVSVDLSQSVIDKLTPENIEQAESLALDTEQIPVYSDPVLPAPAPAPAPVPAVPEVPTIPSTPMDNFFDPSFDWGNIPSGSGFGVELDSTIWDNFDLDFSFVDSFNVDLTSFDWGLSPDLGIAPMIDAFTESGGVFDFSALGNAWGISLDGFMTEDLFVPPTTDLFELAANTPGLSAQQFAYATGSSIAEAGAVETIVSNAESSGDFWGTFDGMLKSTTAAIGALAKLYISYKTAEAQISAVAGKTGKLPTTSSRPTQPGQIVRQPDGSISIMDANGNVQTIRPNGSTQTTAPNQQLPTFSNLFSKQNLMIGGAALAAGVLVFLSTKRK